jgi:poly-gamma-glutamate synthesis protein (capsule biosynthesis protein)
MISRSDQLKSDAMPDHGRRRLLGATAMLGGIALADILMSASAASGRAPSGANRDTVTLFLSGDVMTGRGIDQILPHPSDPVLYEPYMRAADGYVALAERNVGRIDRSVSPDYIWGDARAVLAQRRPDLRIVNLETAVTNSSTPWPNKDIHYRMHPENLAVLTAADIDCCVLANNHVLDWGRSGLLDTLAALQRAGIATAGAGPDAQAAGAPARLATPALPHGGSVLVFAIGVGSSGIPAAWTATDEQAGIHRIDDLSDAVADRIAEGIGTVRRPADLTLVSIHWGGNWGYAIPEPHRRFAHRLIDSSAVDAIHGHSSHHPLGIEVYRGRPILYGCGDLLNDYEGIGGHDGLRPDLGLMYFATHVAGSGQLLRLELVPMRIERLRLNRATRQEARWLRERLARESDRFRVSVALGEDDTLELSW